jgi:O-antigen/teichoic acid export membrane protein
VTHIATPDGITSRVARGVGMNVLDQALNAIGQLVLVPVFLTYWGVQLYGEWLTLSAAVGYLSIVDFGMQMFVINRLNQCHAVGLLDEYNGILHSAYFLSLIISIASFCILSGALAFLPINRWFHISVTPSSMARLVLVLLAAQVAFSIPQGLIGGIYRTIGEYPRGVSVGVVQKGITFLATGGTLIAGAGLPAVASVQILPMMTVAVFVWIDLRRRHPEVHLGIRRRNIRQALSFLVPSLFFFLIPAAMALTFQGSTLIVGALYGAGAVAAFVTLRTLANVLRQGFSAVNHALWPELTALEATKRFETLREVFLLSSKATLLLSFCGAIFLLFEGNELVRLWTRGGIVYDHRLMVAFLILLVSQIYWLTSTIVLVSSNNHHLLSICYLVSGIIGVSLGYNIGSHFGAPGVVLGLLVGDLLSCFIFVPWQACRQIGQNYSKYLSEILLRGIPIFLVLLVVAYLVSLTLENAPPIFRIASVGVVTVLVGVSAGYFLWFRSTERRRLNALLVGVLPASIGRFCMKVSE